MSWADIESAVIAAVKHASGLAQVRLSTEDRKQDRKQYVDVAFELDVSEPPEHAITDSGAGVDVGAVPELRLVALLEVVSYTHDPTVSAYAIAYRLLGRSYLDATLALLTPAGLVLDRVRGAVPVAREADQRSLSAVALAWEMRVRYHEAEGVAPAGLAPRQYFDRVQVTEDGAPLPTVALDEDLVPASVLELATWRALWLGTRTDLVGGRVLDDLVAGALHNVPEEIGSDVLDRATVFGNDLASLEASDADLGALVEGTSLVLVLRAPAAAGRVAARSSDGIGGWTLDAEADGSLTLAAPAAGLSLSSAPGVLDGATWRLVALSLVGDELSLRVQGEVPVSGACTYAQVYEDVRLVVGAHDGEPGAEGLAFALLGEARAEDVDALLDDLAGVLGL